MDFSVRIIALVKDLKAKHESVIANQIGRSGTSIGANIREAHYAHSKPDFVNKLQIALKECYETEYWLTLLSRIQAADSDIINRLSHDCGVIRRILIASVNTTKENL